MARRARAKKGTGWCVISLGSLFLLKPAVWFHNIDAAASPAGGGTFCFLPRAAVAAAHLFWILEFYRYFQLHRVRSQFQAALVQILGRKSQIGEREDLTGHCSFACQQLAEWELSWAWRASWYHFRPQVFDYITFMLLKLGLSFDRAGPPLAAAAPKSGQRGSVEAPSSSVCQLVRSRALFSYCLQTLHSLSWDA